MDPRNSDSNHYWRQTRIAYVWSHLLSTPFWGIYNLMAFILVKDLQATPWQIAVMVTLKPVVAILSMYWSSMIIRRRDRLLPNLNWAKVLGFLPFFFFPWIDNIWLIIFFWGLFIMLARGVIPAWMEILKLNVPEDSRRKIFSYVSAIGYLGGGVLPIVFGWLMDNHFQAWRWLFPLVAAIGILGFFFQRKIPIPKEERPIENRVRNTISHHLMHPWKKSWELIRSRPDFAHFQIGFMIGGLGIMIWQPALPFYFVDYLKLSYTELAIAISLCKGIGFVVSVPLWTRWMQKVNIFRFTSCVTLLASFFPLCLLAAQYNLLWIYVAHLCYGIMQAGSEMSWNLSGPMFAKKEDSSVYSSINVLTVGMRGCVGPPIGTLLNIAIGSPFVLSIGSILCLLGSLRMITYSKRKEYRQETT